MATSTDKKIAAHYTPDVDILEREREYVIRADMPGVDEASVDITLDKNVLTVYGTTSAPCVEVCGLEHKEYALADYKRVFTLSDEIDREAIKASVTAGTLTLTLPKAEAAAPRKIAIAAS